MNGFSTPILPSCELYSFLVVYICTFCLSDCLGGVGGSGGVALMYIIPSIRFELDFYRILCRVFCFGEILPVVRDFCSLSLVSVFVSFHLPLAANTQGADGGVTIVGVFIRMQWWSRGAGIAQRRSGSDPFFFSACLTSRQTTLPPGECALTVKKLVFKLCGIASACCMSHCITPPYPAAL